MNLDRFASGLPNRQEDIKPPMGICDLCGGEQYQGDTVYDFDGECICPDCVMLYLNTMHKVIL